MSDETTVETVATEEKVVAAPATGETAEQKIARLEADAAKTAELLAKVRKFEKENKTAAEKAQQRAEELERKVQEEESKRTELETKIRNRIVDAALEKALVDAKAVAPSTALKLLDKAAVKVDGEDVDAASVKELIDALQKSDPVLFTAATTETKQEAQTNIQHPPVKKAAEGEVVAGFEKEMRAAKTQKAVEDVLRKYGKMS